jgi:hypothetical protein
MGRTVDDLGGSACVGHMIEIGSKAPRLPAPAGAVWESLTDPLREGGRPWLHLLTDEISPQILHAEKPNRVVWSSL